MRERTVGRSGLVVGCVGLGTLTWGRDTSHEEARGQLEAFVEAGGNLIDTSPAFGRGTSEATIGELLDVTVDREDVILCTRAGFTEGPAGMRFGAGRGPILDSLRASLERMNTTYVDVLLVAAPDPLAPDEETASTLGWLVDRGLVRYVGIQGYAAWRGAVLCERLRAMGLPLLTVAEQEYSLLHRGVEEEIVPMADHLGLGIFASSPLGRGVLTGKYRHSIPPTSRAASEHLAAFVRPYLEEGSRRVVEAVARAADGLGRTPADVALSWTVDRAGISAAVVGARTTSQLQSVLSKVAPLPDLVVDALDDVSSPHS
ncbi:oxidoreductase, aldo/keto reductase family protein [Actinobaculum sp. oral taxon 183 str. F0552]|uniref:aldo/keto reductase n=1 Tax=Actinobaculum sp. oral taxon 183 TaxID=712888 RepID=UPI00039789D8|nr:aldo/keto reductase [Actinobaculum sp. oral taxon 183]ERH16924.1 oxidoreductase, aldo/keto reductase family protein [Actinobaculum sp. oral taxon 183 str. F0552]